MLTMFYVYVLKSKKDNFLYIGSTNDLRRRLTAHNSGKVRSTANRLPFSLRYYEAYFKEADARKREINLKKDGRAVHVLKQRIAVSLQ